MQKIKLLKVLIMYICVWVVKYVLIKHELSWTIFFKKKNIA